MKEEKKIKICVFTGTRADYGILSRLMGEIKKSRDFKLQIIASGAHLCVRHGFTIKEIESDGFLVDKKVEILLSSDTPSGVAKSMALGVMGFSEALGELKSDLAVVLGDRYEAMAMAAAAVMHNIPLVHIHGGELTQGSMDEMFRHAITKMSRLHFVSTEEYRLRVIQMGETPDFVYNVGAPGVENIKKIELLPKKEIEKALNFKFGDRNILVCYHPQTIYGSKKAEKFSEVLDAFESLAGVKFIFTMPNADCGGEEIRSAIKNFVAENNKRAVVFDSLGKKLYFSVMKIADAVAGNSSSGIIEAPSFKIGTVNIGRRQNGRARSESVIDCPADSREIIKAFDKLYSEEFQKKLSGVKNIYEKKDTAANIVKIIKKMYVKIKSSGEKAFYDINSLK